MAERFYGAFNIVVLCDNVGSWARVGLRRLEFSNFAAELPCPGHAVGRGEIGVWEEDVVRCHFACRGIEVRVKGQFRR